MTGLLALLERSLRLDSRAWAPHLARFGMMLGIYAAATIASMVGWRFGAPGLQFFRSAANLNLLFMTLLGVGFFSTVITEEKEEDTLGLMLMAGVSPLGILIGKSGGRLVQALLLMIAQIPFTLLAITLGGVTGGQIMATYAALIAYVVLLNGIGLFCSAATDRNRTASKVMITILFLYWLLPFISRSILKTAGAFSGLTYVVLDWVSQSCVFSTMNVILETGFQQSPLSCQVIANVGLGALGFLLAWAVFGFMNTNSPPDSSSRGFVTITQGSIRVLSPGRSSGNPFVWKDFHFVAGGVPGLGSRLVFYLLLYLLTPFIWTHIFGTSLSGEQITERYLFLTALSTVLDAGWMVSRALQEEVRGQTLTSLYLLPHSTGAILYSKMIGVLLVCSPGLICLLLGWLGLPGGKTEYVVFLSKRRVDLPFDFIHACDSAHCSDLFAVRSLGSAANRNWSMSGLDGYRGNDLSVAGTDTTRSFGLRDGWSHFFN